MQDEAEKWDVEYRVVVSCLFSGCEFRGGGGVAYAQTHIAIAGDSAGNVHSLTLNGVSSYVQNWVTNIANGATLWLLVTDLDGDGGKDIIASALNNGDAYLCRLNEQGAIQWCVNPNVWAQTPQFPCPCNTDGLFAEDVNGDGKKEIIFLLTMLGNPNPSGGLVVLNRDGTVRTSFTPFVTNGWQRNGPDAMAMGDMNADGVRDAVLWDAFQHRAQVVNLTTTPPTIIDDFHFTLSGIYHGFILADVTGDQQLDFLTAGESGSVAVFRRDGSLVCSRQVFAGGAPLSDAYTSELGGGIGQVWGVGTTSFGTVTGNITHFLDPANCNDKFPPPSAITDSGPSRGFIPALFADVDGDGIQEAIGNSGERALWIGSPDTAPPVIDCEIPAPAAAVFGPLSKAVDLDGNGAFEILAVSGSPNSVVALSGCNELWRYPLLAAPGDVEVYSDTTSPDPPTNLATSPVSPANNNNPSVTGNAEAGSTVDIYIDAACTPPAVGTGVATGGTFSIPVTVADNTTTTFYATATNGSGTSPCSIDFATYVEDSTAPTITKSIPGTPQYTNGNNTYVTSATTIRVSVSDGTCIIVVTGPGGTTNPPCAPGNNDFTISGSDGSYTISATATDAAGNTSNDPMTVILDNTTPNNYQKTIGDPKYVSGSDTYVKSTTPISVIADDGSGSGIANCTLQIDAGAPMPYTLGSNFTLPPPDGAHTLKVVCTDNLGNASPPFTETDIVDDTAPTVTVTKPSGGEVLFVPSVFTITWTATDSGSGLKPNSSTLEYFDGTTWKTIVTNEACDGSYDWNVPADLDSNQAQVRVTCLDNVTNSSTGTSATFTATLGLLATKDDQNARTGSETLYEAGDSIEYTITLQNRSKTITLQDHSDPEFTDAIADMILIPNRSCSASSGKCTYEARTRTYSWNGEIAPLGLVTIRILARIPAGLRGESARRVCNQGTVKVDFNGDGTPETTVLTDDPDTPATADTTCLDITLRQDIGRDRPFSLDKLEAYWLPKRDAFQFEALGTGIKAISVYVFSLKGERIHQSGWVANGHEWRLEDRTGRKLANGVYLYVMTVRGYDERSVKTQVKKLMIGR
jgi:hypothetical protein